MVKRIVIIGGGFAGVRCALNLAQKLSGKAEIVLINKRNYHVYRPDLYEVATAFSKEISEVCKTKLSETVALELNKIFDHKSVRVLVDEVTNIDRVNKLITLKDNTSTRYDYLVLALGSVINDFGIPGITEHAYSLKTAQDAIKLSCNLDKLFFERWKNTDTKPISIVIGGGGATGVELACELRGYVTKLAEKYCFQNANTFIKIIEGSAHLAGNDARGTEIILKRFKSLNITAELEARITKVDSEKVAVKTSKKEFQLKHDFFIWTGGVKPHPLIQKTFKKISARGGVLVNRFLQTVEDKKIYACGDNAHIINEANKQPVPWLAQCAIQEGALVAQNLISQLNKKTLTPFKLNYKGIVIPLGKKHGLFVVKGKHLTGRIIWWLRRLIDLRYAVSVLPWWHALKKWIAANRLFAQND